MIRVTIAVLLSVTVSPSATAVQRLRSSGVGVECWETRCQRDWWLIKGCDHYRGMTETKRVPCESGGYGGSGHVYTCCRPTNTSEPQNDSYNNNGSCDESTAECRPTVDGCRVYNTTGIQSPCADGHQYVCCEDDVRDDEDDDYGTPKKGRMTFFHLGKSKTACGKTYCDKDMVGALGPAYFSKSNPNNDPVCGKKVKIVGPGSSKYVVVRIVDKCGGCSKYDINVSPAAFEKIKPLRVSVTDVKWAFVS